MVGGSLWSGGRADRSGRWPDIEGRGIANRIRPARHDRGTRLGSGFDEPQLLRVDQKSLRADEHTRLGQSGRVAQEPTIFEEDNRRRASAAHLQIDQQALDRQLADIPRRLVVGSSGAKGMKVAPDLRWKDFDPGRMDLIKRQQTPRFHRRARRRPAIDRLLLDHIGEPEPKVRQQIEQAAGCKREQWPRVRDQQPCHARCLLAAAALRFLPLAAGLVRRLSFRASSDSSAWRRTSLSASLGGGSRSSARRRRT